MADIYKVRITVEYELLVKGDSVDDAVEKADEELFEAGHDDAQLWGTSTTLDEVLRAEVVDKGQANPEMTFNSGFPEPEIEDVLEWLGRERNSGDQLDVNWVLEDISQVWPEAEDADHDHGHNH